MTTVFLPFDLPIYKDINSHHPLLAGLYRGEPYDGIRFVGPLPPETAPANLGRVRQWETALRARLEPALRGKVADIEGGISEFLRKREPLDQARTNTAADLAFFHTTPVSLLQQPFVLHTEQITTLFYPHILTGHMADTRLRNHPVYWIIRAMLEAPECRAIFTNLGRTRTNIGRVFDSEIVAAKTHHVDAGPNLSVAQRERLAGGFQRRQTRYDEISILFTNSWHQHPTNFLLRGGHMLVGAFLAVAAVMPNVRLTLRSSLPTEGVAPAFLETIRTHPRIRVLDKPASDDEIVDLFAEADIFVLNAVALHSVSVLRAAYAGSACVVSDAPGYEEYVEDGVTGMIMRGMHAPPLYDIDPETGYEYDNYGVLLDVTPKLFPPFAHTLMALCQDRGLQRRLGAAARARMLATDRDAGWRRAFEGLVRDAHARTRLPTS